ncbi:hypothetical protein FRC02_007576, partial [Tulasnella sp. 418]
IASGSYDQTVAIWDAKTGVLIRQLKGHRFWVTSVAFSPDGTQIASGSSDQTVAIWDAKTGVLIRQLKGHTKQVTSVAFSPDGTQIASGSHDQTVAIWDAKTGVLIGQLKGHAWEVTSVAFSPDGTQIASGSYDQTVATWDARTGVLRQLKGHTSIVTSVAFSPDRLCLISKSKFETRVWDIGSPNGHPNDANSVEDNIGLFTTTSQSGIEQSPGHNGSVPSIYREGRWIMSNVPPKHHCFLMQTAITAETSLGYIFAFGTRSGDFYILDFSNLFPAA